jgi:hypothetical protein
MSKHHGDAKHNRDLLRRAGDHVFALFRDGAQDGALVYHGYSRARELVDACKDIAKGLELDDEAYEVALLSAWFYDACYAKGSDDHGKSLELCQEFLEAQRVRRPTHDQIAACFHGVDGDDREARDGAPLDRASDVVHDGRLAALASDQYLERSELLRLELERREGKPFSDADWLQRCIAYFEAHPYRTPYAQLEYGGPRSANLVRLGKLRRKVKEPNEARSDESVVKEVGKTEGMFYHFTRIQVALLGLADRRTSTMIHVNAIMVSIVVALLLRRLEVDRFLIFPTLLLLTVNVVVIFLAIYSMRATRAKLSGEELRAHDTNIFLFTNHAQFSLEEYSERMGQLVADPEQFRQRLVNHMYFVRKLLMERERALHRTYDVFIYGLALAILAFAIALAWR